MEAQYYHLHLLAVKIFLFASGKENKHESSQILGTNVLKDDEQNEIEQKEEQTELHRPSKWGGSADPEATEGGEAKGGEACQSRLKAQRSRWSGAVMSRYCLPVR